MSQLFDLNVHNYSLQELLDFFGLTTNNDAASVDRTCDALKQKIKEDPKLGPVTKGKIHDFLNKAVDRLSQSRHTTAELSKNATGGAATAPPPTPAPAPHNFMQLINNVEQHGDNFTGPTQIPQ